MPPSRSPPARRPPQAANARFHGGSRNVIRFGVPAVCNEGQRRRPRGRRDHRCGVRQDRRFAGEGPHHAGDRPDIRGTRFFQLLLHARLATGELQRTDDVRGADEGRRAAVRVRQFPVHPAQLRDPRAGDLPDDQEVQLDEGASRSAGCRHSRARGRGAAARNPRFAETMRGRGAVVRDRHPASKPPGGEMKMRFAMLAATLAALLATAAHADITIGVTLSVTGPAASLGIPEKNTIEMLPQSIAGETIKWIVLDDASDTTKAVTNTRKLISEDKADVIIGSTVTPNSLAMVDVVSDAQLPMISLAASARIVDPANPRTKWVFKTPQSDTLMADAIAVSMKANGVHTMGYIGFADA